MITLSGASAMIQATTADQLSSIPDRFLDETKEWVSLLVLAFGVIISLALLLHTKNQVIAGSVLFGAMCIALVVYYIDAITFRLFPGLFELFTGWSLDGTPDAPQEAPPAAERAPGA